jgi:hypothetical protein
VERFISRIIQLITFTLVVKVVTLEREQLGTITEGGTAADTVEIAGLPILTLELAEAEAVPPISAYYVLIHVALLIQFGIKPIHYTVASWLLALGEEQLVTIIVHLTVPLSEKRPDLVAD